MTLKKYLLAPGPVPVPPQALNAMAAPIIHHRSPDFVELFSHVKEDLRWLYQTELPVLILAATGTGGMEGSVTNFLSPGDKALVVNGGKFGERWTKICKAYGIQVTEIKCAWGESVDVNQIEAALKADPTLKAVYMQASETSTGAAHDVKAVADLTRNRETLCVVDAITALGVVDLPMDTWGIDLLISGSQKAFMLPPGLAFVGVSEKAWRFNQTATCPRFYFDFAKEKKALEGNQTAYTPAVSLIVGLGEVLKIMRGEGLENVFARHTRLAHATREGMKAAGLTLFPKGTPSSAVTAVNAPDGVDSQDIYKTLRTKYGVTAAGGQDHLKGKIFRIAHLGYADTFDTIIAIAAVEMAITTLGGKVNLGAGVKRAQELLLVK
ncbi:MAG: alanine--glyoxylate aminotransferase family protein [Nitrospirota bacterium]|nr:alanine--glyoxylate aminotransferase family protein [Nitrospirota bacterium]